MKNTQEEKLYLGIDGGGSTCRARLADAEGNILGEGKAGPANFLLGISVVTEQIQLATQAALDQAGMSTRPLKTLHAGLGIAGVVQVSDQQKAEPIKALFADCILSDDAYIACLGAHLGKKGAILILGTGSCAHVISSRETRNYGGWGFALSDHGGGAWLGREAVRIALLALETVLPASDFTQAISERFEHKAENFLQWGLSAKPADYAAFAPVVFEYAQADDPHAKPLVTQACKDVEAFINVLDRYDTGRIALLGGLSALYRRHLSENTALKLCEPEGDALDGALLMAQSQQKDTPCK